MQLELSETSLSTLASQLIFALSSSAFSASSFFFASSQAVFSVVKVSSSSLLASSQLWSLALPAVICSCIAAWVWRLLLSTAESCWLNSVAARSLVALQSRRSSSTWL